MRIIIVVRPKSLLFKTIMVHPLIIVKSLFVVTLYNFLINYIIKLETLFVQGYDIVPHAVPAVDYELDEEQNNDDI